MKHLLRVPSSVGSVYITYILNHSNTLPTELLRRIYCKSGHHIVSDFQWLPDNFSLRSCRLFYSSGRLPLYRDYFCSHKIPAPAQQIIDYLQNISETFQNTRHPPLLKILFHSPTYLYNGYMPAKRYLRQRYFYATLSSFFCRLFSVIRSPHDNTQYVFG